MTSAPYGFPDEAASTKKPTTLVVAGWLGIVVGVLSILGPVFTFLLGKDAALTAAATEAGFDGADSELLDALGESDAFNDAYSPVITKAVIGLIVGVIILALALVARNGATGARIGLTVALVIGMCAASGLQLVDVEVLSSATVAAISITPLLSLITIVLLFLPATNKYAASRKAVARA